MRSYAREENGVGWHSFNETLIQLVDSIRVLGGDFVPAGVKFLAWCVEHLTPLDEEGFEAPFLGLALLALSIQLPAISDDAIVALCGWIDEKVSALLQENQWWATRKMDWLLSTNHHDLKNRRWIDLGRELYRWGETLRPSDKATWVALIGRSLAED